jgi:hypothetical protein
MSQIIIAAIKKPLQAFVVLLFIMSIVTTVIVFSCSESSPTSSDSIQKESSVIPVETEEDEHESNHEFEGEEEGQH